MKSFQFQTPDCLAHALEILAQSQGPVRLLGGGTDLGVALQQGRLATCLLLNIANLPELTTIEEEDGHLSIGSSVTYDQLIASPLLQRQAPLLIQAARTVGSPQIRNRGTIGGNLGNASPAGDLIVALYALQAQIEVASQNQTRKIPIVEFFQGPGRTVLQPHEMITHIHLPSNSGDVTFFWKVGLRAAQAIAVVNLAVQAQRSDPEHLANITVAYGAVAPTVVRAPSAEEVLLTQPLNDFSLQKAARQVQRDITPIDDVRASARYRQLLARDMLYYGLQEALEKAAS